MADTPEFDPASILVDYSYEGRSVTGNFSPELIQAGVLLTNDQDECLIACEAVDEHGCFLALAFKRAGNHERPMFLTQHFSVVTLMAGNLTLDQVIYRNKEVK